MMFSQGNASLPATLHGVVFDILAEAWLAEPQLAVLAARLRR
jgi:hypothetical protein